MTMHDDLDVDAVLALWDGNAEAFSRAVGVSRQTVYGWMSAGRFPLTRVDTIRYRVVPKQKEKLKRMADLEAQLDKEFGRGLFK